MTDWQNQLKNAFSSPEYLSQHLDCNPTEIAAVSSRYPLRITPYYLELIKQVGSPLFRQAIPDLQELDDPLGMLDPLAEESLSPVPHLVHRYPDRALFLVSSQCAMYCRFCTRKRKVGKKSMQVSQKSIAAGIQYLKNTPQIREVLISGGDPFLLSDKALEDILQQIKKIQHIKVIRIGSRTPCTLPMRITPELVNMLKKYHPLYINTHFNHPAEITPEAEQACALLADAGIPLGCQTVLLKGINDSVAVLQELLYRLLEVRVRPYYLMQADLTEGTAHFRTDVTTGLALMRGLIGRVSGMAIPTYILDAPGGKGKIPLTPDYILSHQESSLDFISYEGIPCSYPFL
ncbi:KamA family radical SAM protein [Candidatus Electrothrix sp.]